MLVVYPAIPVSSTGSTSRLRGVSRSNALRAAIVFATAATALIAANCANADALSGVDYGLITLLRGMAAIKMAITVAAIGMFFWRVRNPVPSPVVSGYLVAVSCMVFASVSIWYLSFIALASLVFYCGVFVLLAVAGCEANFWQKAIAFSSSEAERVRRNAVLSGFINFLSKGDL